MSGAENMLSSLGALLQELEAAQGGADPEARARLDQLRQQLQALEEMQERAAHHDLSPRHPHADGTAAGGGGSEGSGAAGLASGDASVVLQQMDGLAQRLSGLEHRLEALDDGTKEVLQQSAGSWLGQLTRPDDGEPGEPGGMGGIVEEQQTEQGGERQQPEQPQGGAAANGAAAANGGG